MQEHVKLVEAFAARDVGRALPILVNHLRHYVMPDAS
jgi:hypothetical protein